MCELSRRASGTTRGFSLVELLAVVVILGVMSSVAIVSMTPTTTARQQAAARHVARDLSYARARAVATGRTVWVNFNTAQGRIAIVQEDPGNPGRAGAVPIADPAVGAGGYEPIPTLYPGVSIVGVSVPGGGADIGFDRTGRPVNSSGTVLVSSAAVTLTGSRTATVATPGGLVTSP